MEAPTLTFFPRVLACKNLLFIIYSKILFYVSLSFKKHNACLFINIL